MAWDLRLADVGKKYRVRRARKARPLLEWAPPSDDFWALRGVSLDVEPGEVVGVIGPNGAGKSTLLKLLSRITAPTEGEIRIRGRLAALIEVGSGFHPELTGRENVFLSGTILGMRRRDIAARFDSIVEFSGVGTYIDMPVKWYSSGMYVRLGFSVAAHLEPDILLVDEVLAVGDAAFQAQCLRRIQELRHRGTTIVFISHDLGTVERLCSRAVLLREGRVKADGSARDVVTAYQRAADADAVAAVDLGEENGRDPRITGLAVTTPGAAGRSRRVGRARGHRRGAPPVRAGRARGRPGDGLRLRPRRPPVRVHDRARRGAPAAGSRRSCASTCRRCRCCPAPTRWARR